jgi:hypothetical protein
MSKDELRHIVVGDPDPTPALSSEISGHPVHCGFEWADEASRNLTLLWSCTRKPGHPGQHLAGTGDWVAAVHPETQNYPARTERPDETTQQLERQSRMP